jgi:23S rRNA (uracil1939-C5)-methyltransferase
LKKKYKPGELLDVKIEKIVPKGLGLAFAENLTVFVPLAAGGDRLRVKISYIKGKTAFAETVEILQPSDERQTPPCVYFGRCGGCDFQQLSYENQLRAKTEIIRDCLTRIGKIEYEREISIIASPRALNYRARVRWHLDTGRRKIGYYRRNSHDVIDVVNCPILTAELNDALEKIREIIEWETFSARNAEIEAAAGADGKVSVYSTEILEPTEEISFAVGGEKYFYSSKSFFQGNPFLIEDLLKLALENANGKRALDLYCGVGLFTPTAKPLILPKNQPPPRASKTSNFTPNRLTIFCRKMI